MPVTESSIAFLNRQMERVRLAGARKRIVFPEGSDPRVLEAAARLARDGMAEPVLIAKAPAEAPPGVTFILPETSPQLPKYAALYHERRRAKGVTALEAAEIARRPEYFGHLMLAAGDADGSVCGAIYTSRDTLRAMLHCIGTLPTVRLVTSLFVLAVRNRQFGHNGLLGICDASTVIQPSPTELADMAISAAGLVRLLFETEPAVALLSYSTKGSGGRHKDAEKVVEALRVVRSRAPELNVDGELQADTALVPAIGSSKAPGSTVAGRANTLVFPDLTSANIAVKMVERLGDAAAIGPFIMGLAKPANDLSRGCSADDIYSTAIVTCLQAAGAGPTG
ncbi:MAG: phosphate acetyltransferase [Bryobacterales bacterium]|nr:phosphate acetyltransferase [Bryobacterales bacterium]